MNTWTDLDLMRVLKGNPDVIRLSASLLERREGDCRDFAAAKARPQLRPRDFERPRYAPWEDFPLGLVMRVLDTVEFDGVDCDAALSQAFATNRDPIHPGVKTWVRHACHTYIETSEALSEQLELQPERDPRIVQWGSSVAEHRAMTAWGRWYGTADGSMLEFRRLRIRRPFGTADGAGTLAMAFVAAAGSRVVDPRDLYTAIPVPVHHASQAPERVRVVEVGLTTGADLVLIDASPAEIRREQSRVVRPAATDLLAGGGRRPGRDCVGCKARSSCADLVATPGLLGLSDTGTHRRTWSITTSRYYEICPAQAHLREVRIPAEWDGTAAVQRGRDVHRWLAAAHGRGVPCVPADLPPIDADDCGLADELMEREDYHQARPYLVQHLTVCPLRGPGEISEVRPEPALAAYDALADVVVLANPDLLRRVDGRLVYREQKTAAVSRGVTPENVLEAVPQLALAVCLISAGYFGAGGGLVELEQLHPHEAEPLIVLDAADPAVAAAARDIVHRRVKPWHRDVSLAATPGWWCQSCPVSRWCPAADSTGGKTRSDDNRVSAIADTLHDADLDDEPPF